MERSALVDQVYPVSRITGEGRAETCATGSTRGGYPDLKAPRKIAFGTSEQSNWNVPPIRKAIGIPQTYWYTVNLLVLVLVLISDTSGEGGYFSL